ncbi:hypothetical protein KCTCHS21_13720 [Cohnella abietis]|uniref:Uncharacterized protein n=1 Tax=Cohnella abietis TaxID=2507935 RepID=A0A3T1D1I6_9BACL|nr:hypothetical protein KCTCHS21_13720 [Cohnella abietis]
MYDYFEQLCWEEARLAGDVRLFRATGFGGGTIEGRCTIISSNCVGKRHEWR